MSGSKEERPTVADVTSEPETAPEAAAGEADVEMSAAEALARATEAAAGRPAEEAAPPEPAASEPETTPDAEATTEEDPSVAAVDEESQPVTPQAEDSQADEQLETAPETDAAPEPEIEVPASEVVTQEPAAEATSEIETEEPAAETTPEIETQEPTADTAPEAEAETETEATAAEETPEAGTDEPTVGVTAETEADEATVEAAPEGDSETPTTETAAGQAGGEAPPAVAAPKEAAVAKKAKKAKKKPVRSKPKAPPVADRPELVPVLAALENRKPLEGRVIGWNHGGFHLALGELSAFCPRSEMEIGEVKEPESYLDQTFEFRVLRLQGKGRRIVVSRAAHLRNEKSRQRSALRKKLQVGTELDGTVASLKDFGAFVDLGGSQGLVHVSEISHRRVEHPSDVLSEGQEVRVKVLKVEQGGNRISLSMRALEPNPWKDLADRFPQGAVVTGTVEKANQIGAFIELAPGLTGLLPARSMTIPRETTPARAYPPGKEVSVQIVSVDPRRQRISLGLEGSGLEGSRNDYKDYQRQSHEEAQGDGFNALASAFRRLQGD